MSADGKAYSPGRYATPIVPLPPPTGYADGVATPQQGRANDRTHSTVGGATGVGMGGRMMVDSPSLVGVPVVNYPSIQPLFHLPSFPDMERTPPPRELPKLPPPGYDMRSLRKQVDALQIELESRIDGQADLYLQNERLWEYMDTLLDANKMNSERLKDHVGLLHRELFALHRERFRLATHLKDARDSASILRELQNEHLVVGQDASEVDKLRLQAQRVLLHAQDENSALERDLETQLHQMNSAHAMLEDLRSRRQEDQFDETADEFWWTSKTVLRSAYRRFKKGIAPHLRARRTATVMVSVFTRVEKATALAAWVAYVHRRRVMHIADRRRAVEMTVMCLAAWKTHVALERYFLHSFRRRTLTATFIAWRDDIRQRRWELTTDSRLRVFKMRQRLRRHFGEWKRTVMFLGWNSSRLIELGDDADHCYKRSVFERLKKRAGVALARERESEQLLRLRAARRPFRAWREVCHMRWRRRGNMLRRFFAHSRDAITVRRHTQTGYRAAIQYWLDTKRASYFRCWHKLTRQRTRGHGSLGTGTTDITAARLTRHRQRRLARAAVYLLQQRGAAGKRATLWRAAAALHADTRLLMGGFGVWYTVSTSRRTRRYALSLSLARSSFECWRAYVPMLQRQAQVLRVIESKCNIRNARLKRSVLQDWYSHVRSDRVMRRATASVARLSTGHCQRRAMRTWRSAWGSAVYIKAKETAVEVARAAALNDIKGSQIADLQGQRDTLAATAEAYQAQLQQREREVSERDAAMARLNESKDQQSDNISALQAQVADMQGELLLARQEQERMKKIEDAYFATRRSEEAALHKRKQEASALLDAMTRDSARLRDEVSVAQHQSQTSGRMAEAEEEKEQALLDAAIAEAAAEEGLLGRRRVALDAQERANISVESQVTGLKDKLQTLGGHADALMEEEARERRVAQSALQSAAASATGFEAKEAELESLLADKRLDLGRMHLSEVAVDEDRAMFEIASITQSVLDRSPGGYSGGAGPGRSPLRRQRGHVGLVVGVSSSSGGSFVGKSSVRSTAGAAGAHEDVGAGLLSGFNDSGLDLDLGLGASRGMPSEARNLLDTITARLAKKSGGDGGGGGALDNDTSAFDLDLDASAASDIDHQHRHHPSGMFDGSGSGTGMGMGVGVGVDSAVLLSPSRGGGGLQGIGLGSPDSDYRDARRRVSELTDKYATK